MAVCERGSDSRNSRIDSTVSALGRVIMVSECLDDIDGESVVVVVVCVMVGQNKEGVEVCALAVVVVVSLPECCCCSPFVGVFALVASLLVRGCERCSWSSPLLPPLGP